MTTVLELLLTPQEIADALDRVMGLHTAFSIYDSCGHEHTHQEFAAGECLLIQEVCLTCEDGRMYDVCRPCCLDGGEYQDERCAMEHVHGKDVSICPTMAAIEDRL